jgi:GNAT superfamily N-acetyltransferase
MIDKLKIILATQYDLSDVLKLYAQQDIDNGDILTLKEANTIYSKFSKYPNYMLYIAKIDESIVGTFSLLIMDNIAHQGRPSAIIEDIVVDIKYRYQGIGREMLKHAMETSKKNGCYKLALSSNLKREQAHAFYERLGLKKHGYSFLIEL